MMSGMSRMSMVRMMNWMMHDEQDEHGENDEQDEHGENDEQDEHGENDDVDDDDNKEVGGRRGRRRTIKNK